MLTRPVAGETVASMPGGEPDFGAPPAAVVAIRDALAAGVAGVIPAKRSAENLPIGTWNLRAFGDLTKDWVTPAGASPLRNFADIVYISTVARSFDVVAVQEVHGNLRALRYLMKVLGEEWAFIMTDVTKGPSGNNERLAFLFDTTRVKPSGLACELVIPEQADTSGLKPGALNHQFARTP